jgi:hypothetical protein
MRSLLVIKSLPFAIFSLVIGCLAIAAPAAGAASTAAGTAGQGGPGGQQTVSFRGVSVTVPASWTVVNLTRHPRACPRLDVRAVYLGTPGPDPACPAELRGRATAVQLEQVSAASPDRRRATAHAVIDGRAALTNPDAGITHQIIDLVPSAGVEVSLSYGTSAERARFVEKSIRVSGRARAVPLAAPAAVTPAPAQGVVTGAGFDTCAAPSAATMRDWLASPYRSVGIYIGGVNRACAQANLTAAWIRAIQAEGWHYFPLYVGLQASCVAGFGDATISAAKAAAQGSAAAADAVTQAAGLGIPAGTPLIFDMEAYRGGCGTAVTTFLSAWDSGLHAKGYAAGIYESFSNIGDLTGAAARITEPDVIHYADWDGKATTTSSYMPATRWTSHQRIHQYRGGHNESWGGAKVNIDNDQLDVALGGSGTVGAPPAPTPPPGPGPTPQPTPTPKPTPTPGPTPPHGPSPAIRPRFRIATALNSNGTAEWFARAANGTVQHDYQHPIGSAAWWGTRAVGNSPAQLAGNPAVAASQGGALTLFARTAAGQIVHAWQQPGAPNDWQWGGPVGGGNAAKLASDPGAVQAPDGDVTVFAATASGQVLTTRQSAPGANTSWTAWAPIGGDCAGAPVPVVAGGRTLEVFCVTGSGALDLATLGASGWSSWSAAGTGPGGLTGTPAVVTGSGGATEVAVTAGGKLALATQNPATGAWTWGASPAGTTGVRNSPAAAAWPDGRVAVFARQANAKLGFSVRSASGSWGPWTVIGGHVLGSPAAWVNTGGTPEVAILDRQLKLAVSTYSGAAWAPWAELGGGF